MTTVPLKGRPADRGTPLRTLRLRWPLALLIAGGSIAGMMLLALLQGGDCAGRVTGGCIDVPVGVLYVLHAVAVVCCLWAVFGALLELLDARRRAARSADAGSETHR